MKPGRGVGGNIAQIISSIRDRGLRGKLTRQMLWVGLVPVIAILVLGLVVGYLQQRAARATLERQVAGASVTTYAKNLMVQIDSYMEERIKDVQTWAADPLVIDAAIRGDAVAKERGWPGYPAIATDKASMDRIEEQMKATRALLPNHPANQYLVDQLARSKVFKEVFVTDKNGYNVAISNMTSDFVQSDEEWWVDAWEKEIDIGGTTKIALQRTPDAPRRVQVVYDESAGVWSVAISVRFDHPRSKEPLGVMKAVLDISAIQALATQAAAAIQGSDVKVVNREGMLIADTTVKHDRKFIMSKEGNLLNKKFKPMELVAQGPATADYLIGVSETPGTAPPVEQVIGYARSAGKGGFKDLPEFEGLGWGVILGQDQRVAFAPITTLQKGELTRFGLTVLVAALVAVGAVWFGASRGRRISQPIQELGQAARQISTGDLNVQVPVRSADEIGQLARAFNESVVRLRGLVQTEAERDEERRRREELQANIIRFLDAVQEMAQGDLSRRGEVTSDVLGNVVDAINLMVEELGALIGDVRQAALQVASSAREMNAAAERMAAGAQTQAREAMEASTAVEELTLSVRQVATNAEASAGAARQSLEAAQQGNEAVRNSLGGMQRIRAEVQGIARRVKALGDRSLEISQIVNTIEEIASQTNMLALNVAIEAAGAGEAGLRFAVVADEVRKLAERSSQATKDIGAVIKNIQAEIQEAVVGMEQGTREVEAGYRITLQAGESLQQIARVSERSTELVQDISRASLQQVRGTEGVAAAVQSIASVAVQTEEGAVQTQKTVEELVRLAEVLTQSLARFKLAA